MMIIIFILIGTAIFSSFIYFDPLNLEFLNNNETPEIIDFVSESPRGDVTGASDRVTLKLERQN